MKNLNNINAEQRRQRLYYAFCTVCICLIAFTFLFPLYWIITGSFKAKSEIISSTPSWWPKEWVMTNYQNLMSKRTAPLFDFEFGGWRIPFFGKVLAVSKFTISGPTVPRSEEHTSELQSR